MSGPVVVIGYIFLVPSILGILASALMFFGVVAYKGDESSGTPATEQIDSQETQSDDGFRRACAAGVIESVQEQSSGLPTLVSVVHTCECSLNSRKQGNFSASTTNECAVRWLHADDQIPAAKTEAP
jgi:hypothetical protein